MDPDTHEAVKRRPDHSHSVNNPFAGDAIAGQYCRSTLTRLAGDTASRHSSSPTPIVMKQ